MIVFAGSPYVERVIKVVRVKLLTDTEQFSALSETLAACNNTANLVSCVAHEHRKFRERDLRAITYAQARAHAGLGAQATQSCIRKVAGAYAALRANLRAGNYGAKDSPRRVKVESAPVTFRPNAAQPFDDRCLSWRHDPTSLTTGTVSIWTTTGRVRGVGFVGHPAHVGMLRRYRKGETDLVIQDGVAYLLACVEVPVAVPVTGDHLSAAPGWIGVDLGIANIAVTSDRTLAAELMTDFGDTAPEGPTGRGSTKDRRTRNRELREKLQRKGTKSAKRLLRQRRLTESRFGADVNHQISKRIVAEAERTGRGIAIEYLTGIRARVRLRKPQRATHSSWAFAQLGTFLAYKAEQAGVPLVQVDPAYTSQRCTVCGHTSRKNRTCQAVFSCQQCGFVEHADLVGADNIALLGPSTYRAESTVPSAA